jgi:hypothetical protein
MVKYDYEQNNNGYNINIPNQRGVGEYGRNATSADLASCPPRCLAI